MVTCCVGVGAALPTSTHNTALRSHCAGDEADGEASTSPVQSETELEASLTAAYDYEKCMPMPADWTDAGHQSLLDVELQYTLTSAIWDGVYVTMEPEPDMAPLGDEDHTDVDPAELFRSLKRRHE